MKKTTDANLDDRLCELEDISVTADAIREAIACAESVETPADFDANIDEALEQARGLVKALDKLREAD
jgi:hypothetical protein